MLFIFLFGDESLKRYRVIDLHGAAIYEILDLLKLEWLVRFRSNQHRKIYSLCSQLFMRI